MAGEPRIGYQRKPQVPAVTRSRICQGDDLYCEDCRARMKTCSERRTALRDAAISKASFVLVAYWWKVGGVPVKFANARVTLTEAR
jgi:hypothetical protein